MTKAEDFLNSNLSNEDKVAFVLNKCKLNKERLAALHIECINIIAPLWLEKSCITKETSAYIQAIKDFKDKKIDIETLIRFKMNTLHVAYTNEQHVNLILACHAELSAKIFDKAKINAIFYDAEKDIMFILNNSDTETQKAIFQLMINACK